MNKFRSIEDRLETQVVDRERVRTELYKTWKYKKLSPVRELAIYLAELVSNSYDTGHRRHQLGTAWLVNELLSKEDGGEQPATIHFADAPATERMIKRAKQLLSSIGFIELLKMSVKDNAAAWWTVNEEWTVTSPVEATRAGMLLTGWQQQPHGIDFVDLVLDELSDRKLRYSFKNLRLVADDLRGRTSI